MAHQMCLISSVLFGGAMGYRAGSNPYASEAAGAGGPIGRRAASASVGSAWQRASAAAAHVLSSLLSVVCLPSLFSLQVGPGGSMLAALGGVSSAYHLAKFLECVGEGRGIGSRNACCRGVATACLLCLPWPLLSQTVTLPSPPPLSTAPPGGARTSSTASQRRSACCATTKQSTQTRRRTLLRPTSWHSHTSSRGHLPAMVGRTTSGAGPCRPAASESVQGVVHMQRWRQAAPPAAQLCITTSFQPLPVVVRSLLPRSRQQARGGWRAAGLASLPQTPSARYDMIVRKHENAKLRLIVTLVHLAVWAQLGVATRAFMGKLFTLGCPPDSWGPCLDGAQGRRDPPTCHRPPPLPPAAPRRPPRHPPSSPTLSPAAAPSSRLLLQGLAGKHAGVLHHRPVCRLVCAGLGDGQGACGAACGPRLAAQPGAADWWVLASRAFLSV